MTQQSYGPPGLVTRVYSFGYSHRSRFTGADLVDHHVTVIAPTAALCRDAMVAMFGNEWSMEYVSLEAATRNGQFPSTEHCRIELDADAYGPREIDPLVEAAKLPADVDGEALSTRPVSGAPVSAR